MLDQPFVIPAALFLLISVPLILKLIPPNRLYGFRVPQTLNDKDTWYRVNAHCGRGIIVSSLMYFAVMAIWPYDGQDPAVFTLHLVAFAGPLLLTLIWMSKSLKKS